MDVHDREVVFSRSVSLSPGLVSSGGSPVPPELFIPTWFCHLLNTEASFYIVSHRQAQWPMSITALNKAASSFMH